MNAGSLLSRTVLPAYFRAAGLDFSGLLDAYAESQHWPRERLREQAFRRLSRLLARVGGSNSFYAERFREAGVSPADVRDLDDIGKLPILEKHELGALLASVPRRGRRWERRTAGPSSRPSLILASARAQAAALAARYRCYGWYGLRLGDREAHFWGRPVRRATLASRLCRLALNRVSFDYRHVRPETAVDTLRRLAGARVDYAYGYASLIMRLARQAERRGLSPPPGLRAAVLTAELSTAAERDWLGGVLDCRVADEYGCSEMDIIAFTCPEGGRHVMAENVVLESVPGGAPEAAPELVVTDLNNELMPLIRYRLGDAGRLADGTCPCGRTLPLLESVRGRSQRQFLRTPEGELVHAISFAYFMEEKQLAGYPIRQFQVVQSVRDAVEVNLVMDDTPARREEIRRELAALVRRYFGDRMDCRVSWVGEIAPEPGRKYEYFISRLDEASTAP